MPSYSHTTLVGHVGRDPEMRFLPSGRPVTSFSVAISDNRYNAETKTWSDAPPIWWSVSVWGESGERANERVRKGQLVMVEGRPGAARAYTTKSGEVRAENVITARSWTVLSKDMPQSADTEPEEVPFRGTCLGQGHKYGARRPVYTVAPILGGNLYSGQWLSRAADARGSAVWHPDIGPSASLAPYPQTRRAYV